MAGLLGLAAATLTLLASCATLLAGIRFIGDMMQSSGESLDYEFKAKLDTGGLFPSIRVSERGSFNLSGSPQ